MGERQELGQSEYLEGSFRGCHVCHDPGQGYENPTHLPLLTALRGLHLLYWELGDIQGRGRVAGPPQH